MTAASQDAGARGSRHPRDRPCRGSLWAHRPARRSPVGKGALQPCVCTVSGTLGGLAAVLGKHKPVHIRRQTGPS